MAGLQIQNPSITSAAFAAMLEMSAGTDVITAISGHPIGGSGGGGTPTEGYWRPSVNEDGIISWLWSTSPTSTVPSTADIMGPAGEQGPEGPQGPSGTNGVDGKDGKDGKDGTNGYSIELQSVTDEDGGKKVTLAWGETPSTSSFVIPSGAKGADGQNGQDGQDGQDGAPGIDGISPTFTTSVTSDAQHPQGGTHVVISGAAGESAFNVWNGVDGEGATVNLVEGDGIQITKTGTDYTIGVSADYALKSELPDVTDMATETWVEEQGYLTTVSSNGAVSGDGTSANPIGINTDNIYTLDGVDPIIVTSGAGNKTIIKATDTAVSALNTVIQNKQVWDSASAKSVVSVNPANNEVIVEGTPNSGISATTYYPRTSNGSLFAAQRIFMVETDADIYQCMTHTDGQGCLFFMLSARS